MTSPTTPGRSAGLPKLRSTDFTSSPGQQLWRPAPAPVAHPWGGLVQSSRRQWRQHRIRQPAGAPSWPNHPPAVLAAAGRRLGIDHRNEPSRSSQRRGRLMTGHIIPRSRLVRQRSAQQRPPHRMQLLLLPHSINTELLIRHDSPSPSKWTIRLMMHAVYTRIVAMSADHGRISTDR